MWKPCWRWRPHGGFLIPETLFLKLFWRRSWNWINIFVNAKYFELQTSSTQPFESRLPWPIPIELFTIHICVKNFWKNWQNFFLFCFDLVGATDRMFYVEQNKWRLESFKVFFHIKNWRTFLYGRVRSSSYTNGFQI